MSELLEDIISSVQKSNSITTELDFDFDTPDIEDMPAQEVIKAVEDESGGSLKFAILGLGQCGGRLAQAFFDLGYKRIL